MAEDKLTTIQIDTDTREKLKELAQGQQRSMPGQLRWMVNYWYEITKAASSPEEHEWKFVKGELKLLPATTKKSKAAEVK